MKEQGQHPLEGLEQVSPPLGVPWVLLVHGGQGAGGLFGTGVLCVLQNKNLRIETALHP